MPFIWVAPGVTQAGTSCDRPVDLRAVYRTVSELAEPPMLDCVESKSIAHLLADPLDEWATPAIITHGFNNHAVRTEKWRFMCYANGDEEWYDDENDPYEWKHLAGDAEFAKVKKRTCYLAAPRSETITSKG